MNGRKKKSVSNAAHAHTSETYNHGSKIRFLFFLRRCSTKASFSDTILIGLLLFFFSDGTDLFCVIFSWWHIINEKIERQKETTEKRKLEREQQQQRTGRTERRNGTWQKNVFDKNESFKANYDNSFLLPIDDAVFVYYFFWNNHAIVMACVFFLCACVAPLTSYCRYAAPLFFPFVRFFFSFECFLRASKSPIHSSVCYFTLIAFQVQFS